MNKLTPTQANDLAKYLVTLSSDEIPAATVDVTDESLDALLQYAKESIGNDRDRVAASMFFRRYAFVMTAQLFMLSKHRVAWQGELQDISIIDDGNNPHWLPTFFLKNNDWVKVEEDKVADSIRSILAKFGAALLLAVAAKTKTSRLVLWENIWSYTLWMYAELLKESDISPKVEKDLAILLNDEVWAGIEKQSPFKKFLGDKTVPESVQSFKRVTCCFYYEIDGNDKCAYCPNAGCSK
ncbi:hypothetical protein HHO41_00080 [Bacillus sp. DNRA2]|uniref:(2Fe-2S)-binding protein n=1 Tax=Bacillus sp. DNRA2 TaxID=2723053 RepID=UPI00145C4342|nr:(2Fe-2S)-binding protein [Bacillus sp. DNRA2]NMD68665.1 hypothetical protein [Bacillus sp. DNRA2]